MDSNRWNSYVQWPEFCSRQVKHRYFRGRIRYYSGVNSNEFYIFVDRKRLTLFQKPFKIEDIHNIVIAV